MSRLLVVLPILELIFATESSTSLIRNRNECHNMVDNLTGPFLLDCRIPELDTSETNSVKRIEGINLTMEEEKRLRIEGCCFLGCALSENYSASSKVIHESACPIFIYLL